MRTTFSFQVPIPSGLTSPNTSIKKASYGAIGLVAVATFAAAGYYAIKFIDEQLYKLFKAYVIDSDLGDKDLIIKIARSSSLVIGAIYACVVPFLRRAPLDAALFAVSSYMCFSLSSRLLLDRTERSKNTELSREETLTQVNSILAELGFQNLSGLAKKASSKYSYPRPEITNQIARALVKLRPFCLVAESGSGKTHLIWDFFSRLYETAELPEPLQDLRSKCVTYGTSASQLESGTKYVGTFADKFEKIRLAAELLRSIDLQLVLYIDEIHMLYNTGGVNTETKSANGMNHLKSLIESLNGEPPLVILVGATTPHEYNETLRRDPAFARRMNQPIYIPSLNDQQFVELLKVVQEGIFDRAKKALKDNLESKEKLSDKQLETIIIGSKKLSLNTAHLEKAMRVLDLVLDAHLYKGVELLRSDGVAETKTLNELIEGTLQKLSGPTARS